MTVTSNNAGEMAPVETVSVTIDGITIDVPKGTLAIRAAEQIGIEIPRFCDHPLLEPVAACRACLIEVEGMPKPQPACAQVVTDGMCIHTQRSSEVAKLAQEGVMEFLLLNHPLDCPVCDKGGECPLQNQAMSVGRPESRFDGPKRTFEKPINISAEILLDRERCVSCARCTRFSEQIAGDPLIALLERGAKQQVGTSADEPFDSYFSGNTVQICPVGALTSEAYRFRARPFDLVSVPTACEHCASGCAIRTDVRRGKVMRRLAWEDAAVNEDWNCDKGRFAFPYLESGRLETPLIRENGELRVASWPEALAAAADGLRAAGSSTGVLTGGRLSVEDAYAYARFARVALGTDDIDFRARANSDEELRFLAAKVAGVPVHVTYESLEAAPTVLLAGFEPEDESPIVFLRLRKAARTRGLQVLSLGAVASRGLAKMQGSLVACLPGDEARTLRELPSDTRDSLRQPGAVIMVGERLAMVPGALSAAATLADETGAALVWVPRRAGERGALDAGALAGLLPGGRPLEDPEARYQVATAWGVEESALPMRNGLSGGALLEAAAAGRVKALLVAGVDLDDYATSSLARVAVERTNFVVSLEQRHSSVTALADVVLPVATVTEKSGTFLDWEGRPRPFSQVFRDALTHTDAAVLGMIADAMGVALGASDVRGLRAELATLGAWRGARFQAPTAQPAEVAGGTRLATWRALLDLGTLQEGEPYLAATARPVVATVNERLAASLGSPQTVVVSGPVGSVELPLAIGEVLDDVVHLPMNSPACAVLGTLGALHGSAVTVRAGGAA